MGFPLVEIRMPEGDVETAAELRQWLVPAGEYVELDKPVAHVLVDGVLHELTCNMPVVLEETLIEAGSKIAPGQLLARALAEGHEIPYGRPYARLEKAG